MLPLGSQAQSLSLPYMQGGGGSRFMNFAAKIPRDIMLSVVKNISESTPIGEVLLNFRAEDKSSPTYNLT
jgi:hypothetical protein